MSQHYVKSVDANRAHVPLAPSVVASGAETGDALGVRAGYRARETGRLRVLESEDGSHHPAPGHYTLERGRFTFGADYRKIPVQGFDFFLSTGWDASASKTYGSLMSGVGLTVPAPGFTFRVAPAVGFLTYRSRSTDSVISTWTSESISPLGIPLGTPETHTDTAVHSNSWFSPRGGGFFAVSLSAWLPEKWNKTAWTPFIQGQYNAVHLSSPGLRSEIVSVREMVWAVGTTYSAGKAGTWNIKVLREGLHNKASGSASYRVETGVEFRVAGRR